MAITNADGSIVLTTKVDTAGLKSGMFSIKSGTTALKGAVSKLGVAIAAAFSVKALVDFSKESSKVATTAEASVQRLIDIYGAASKEVGDFIDANAQAMGMSRAAAANFSAVYGNLFSVWADQATNAELTNKYLTMTAVVASKTGRTVEDVQERVRSGLLGNTEAIEDLGIFVNIKTIEITDAFKRMSNGKSWAQLDAYTQQQIRTMAILEQATAKYGTEVANTSALTKSRFSAAWQDFQATWGQVVNRVLMPVLETLTDIVVMSTKALQLMFNISGSTISNGDAIKESVENQNKLTEAVEDTDKAAKKTLASFDDIQIITSNVSETESGDSAITPDAILGETKKSGSGYADKETFLDSFLEKIKEVQRYLTPTQDALLRFWNVIRPNKESIEEDFNWIKEEVFKPFAGYISLELTPAIVDSFTSAAESIKSLWGTVEEPLKDFWEETAKPIFENIAEFVVDIVEQTSESFQYLSDKFVEYKGEIALAIEGIGAILSVIWSVIKPVIDSIVGSIGGVLKTTIDFIFSVIQVIGNFFGFFKNIFAAIRALIQGDTESAIKYIKLALSNLLNIFIGIANAIISVVNNLWVLLFQAFKGIVQAIGGLVERLGEFVGLDWGLSWNPEVKTIPLIPKYVPALAKGAVLPAGKPFLAMVGDQRQGTNVEAPLQTIVDAMNIALSQNGGAKGGTTEVVLEIDGREFGRAVVEQGNKENRRIGTRLVIA